jgi:hypothetical protein
MVLTRPANWLESAIYLFERSTLLSQIIRAGKHFASQSRIQAKCTRLERSMSGHNHLRGEIQNPPSDLVRRSFNYGRTNSDRPRRVSHRTQAGQEQFQIDTARRRVVQIEGTIADFDRMVNALDAEILVEQSRARIDDPAHFAYPTYAKATIIRRDNLRRSMEGLKDLLNALRTSNA